MTSCANSPESAEEARRARIADAIRIWHRGEKLTADQANIIEEARLETNARAFGILS